MPTCYKKITKLQTSTFLVHTVAAVKISHFARSFSFLVVGNEVKQIVFTLCQDLVAAKVLRATVYKKRFCNGAADPTAAL